jgi:hypothetical protein
VIFGDLDDFDIVDGHGGLVDDVTARPASARVVRAAGPR